MDIAKSIAQTHEYIQRKNRLEWNEKQMETAIKGIASSLKDIHDLELWQIKYDTFDSYCKMRWGMTRQRAYQLIGAEGARLMLADATAGEPALAEAAGKLNDYQAEQFKNVPPGKAADVLRDATSRPGKMTANKIKQAKASVIDAPPPDPADEEPPKFPPAANLLVWTCPHCGKEIR